MGGAFAQFRAGVIQCQCRLCHNCAEIGSGNEMKYMFDRAGAIAGLLMFASLIGVQSLQADMYKFTDKNGTIQLEANVRVNIVEVAVHDTGIGIHEEDLRRIFHKFEQIIPSKGEKTKGTGLGLATVKQIILAHGGKVWATSQVGIGSTFYITLPLAA